MELTRISDEQLASFTGIYDVYSVRGRLGLFRAAAKELQAYRKGVLAEDVREAMARGVEAFAEIMHADTTQADALEFARMLREGGAA